VEELIGGGSPSSVTILENTRCPPDYKQEPALRGYGSSPGLSQQFTVPFDRNWCNFPVDPWPVDRSYLAIEHFDTTFDLDGGQTFSSVACGSANDPVNVPFILALPQLFTGNPKYWDLTSVINVVNSVKDPRSIGFDVTSHLVGRIVNCLGLIQSSLCSGLCPKYGGLYSISICQSAIDKFNQQCAGVFHMAAGSETPLPGYIIALGSNDPNLLAFEQVFGAHFTCIDPFTVPASDKFFLDNGLVNACSHYGPPYVKSCGGQCTVIYTDPNNCGACGHSCGVGGVCVAGVCGP